MQYRPPNANQEVSNPNHFGSVFDSLYPLEARLSLYRLVRSGRPITPLRSAVKRIVSIMKVLIERNNLQLELVRNSQHVNFCEATDSMKYRSPNANQEMSNPNYLSSVSDSLGRLAAVSQFMAR